MSRVINTRYFFFINTVPFDYKKGKHICLSFFIVEKMIEVR